MNKINTPIFPPTLKINHKTHKSICLQEVIMLHGEVNYTTLCLRNGKKIMIAHTLKYFEDQLNKFGFMRVHRAFLVNPDYILKYDSVGHTIEMDCNLFAQVSRRRMKIFRNYILFDTSPIKPHPQPLSDREGSIRPLFSPLSIGEGAGRPTLG